MERILALLLLSLISLQAQSEPGRELMLHHFKSIGIEIGLEHDPYWAYEERPLKGYTELQIETPEHYYPRMVMLFRVMHQPLPDGFTETQLQNATLGAAEAIDLVVESSAELEPVTYNHMQGYQLQRPMDENQVRLFIGKNNLNYLTMLMIIYRSDSETAIDPLVERTLNRLTFTTPQPQE